MIDKTRLGIPFLDERFGGIYRKQPALCIGRLGSGKTIAALHALLQSTQEGERGLLLSAWRTQDLARAAASLGLPLAEACAEGRVMLLEYAHIMPAPDFQLNYVLPPGSFLEFEKILKTNGISRVIIDTILPWVAIMPADKLAKHVYSFFHAMERIGITSLFTLPQPASALAFTLRDLVADRVPVVFTLEVDSGGQHVLQVNKYLGVANLPSPVSFTIAHAAGIVPAAQAPAGNGAPGDGQPGYLWE